MARTKSISRTHVSAGNQRSARKTPVPKSGKKVVMRRQVKKAGKKGAKGVKGNGTGPVKRRYRYKPGSRL